MAHLRRSSDVNRRRQTTRLDFDRFEGLIAAPHDLGAIAPGGQSATPLVLPGNGRLAVSHSSPVSLGDLTVTVSGTGSEDFGTPDLAADEVHRGAFVERGRTVNISRGVAAPDGTLTLYVVDPQGHHVPVATSSFPAAQAPIVDLNGAAGGLDFAAAFQEGDAPVLIADAVATVTDADSPNLTSMTVTISVGLADATFELLDANVGATGIGKSYVAPTLTLTGPSPAANFQQVLRTVTYENTKVVPTEGARTVTFSATDGINSSNTPQTVVTVTALPPAFVANAVNFDGTNDYLNRGAALTGVANTDTLLLSLWFNVRDASGELGYIHHANNSRFDVIRLTNNRLKVEFSNAAGALLWSFETTATYTDAVNPGWHHLLVSADMGAANRRQVYIDDAVPSLAVNNTGTNAAIGYATSLTDTFIGSGAAGANKFNGDLADVYVNHAASPDLSVESNRRKFYDAAGKPEPLGSDGSTPTGTAPIMYFSGPTVDWHTNKGSGGGFTENGALTDATTSPSD